MASLLELDLECNQIIDVRPLTKAARDGACMRLLSLDMGSNHLSEHSLDEIVQLLALERPPVLKKLLLRGNDISHAAATRLREASSQRRMPLDELDVGNM